jgi:hypothetical protein
MVEKACDVCGIPYYIPAWFSEFKASYGHGPGPHFCPRGHRTGVERSSQVSRLKRTVGALRGVNTKLKAQVAKLHLQLQKGREEVPDE